MRDSFARYAGGHRRQLIQTSALHKSSYRDPVEEFFKKSNSRVRTGPDWDRILSSLHAPIMPRPARRSACSLTAPLMSLPIGFVVSSAQPRRGERAPKCAGAARLRAEPRQSRRAPALFRPEMEKWDMSGALNAGRLMHGIPFLRKPRKLRPTAITRISDLPTLNSGKDRRPDGLNGTMRRGANRRGASTLTISERSSARLAYSLPQADRKV